MGSLFGSLLLIILLEQFRKMIQGLLFPTMQLRGMHTVLRSDLSDRFLFSKNLEHDLGFMFGG